ncbi:hypothetical protein L7F22_063204 [Adiantum nelumboides]|nr:hypothetical protein [Adiantum nelumboides]
MFKQLMENPRFMEFLQSSSIAHQVQGSFGMPGTVFRGTQNMVLNPMYANIGLQPGFQGTQGQFGVSQGNLGVLIMQTVSFDNLESMDKPKPYKEDDQSVQFDTLSGFDERTKVLSFLEQFDKAFAERILQKHRKAATFLKGNASQWWNTLLLQGQTPSTWNDFIQNCTAVSTTEAKYVAASKANKETIWLARLVSDLGISATTLTLHCDSQSAIMLAKNPVFHAKTKHISVKYHFIRDVLKDKHMQLVKVHSDDNLTDLLTKGLPSERFTHRRALMGVR